MTTRSWLPWLAVGMLGGCAINGGDRPSATTFDFGLPTTVQAAAASNAPAKLALGNVRLALEVTAPSWFDKIYSRDGVSPVYFKLFEWN